MIQKYYVENKNSKLVVITKRTSGIKRYFKDIQKFPNLSSDEEISLMNEVRNGNLNSREKLINCNLKLVFKEAKMHDRGQIPFEDILSLANEGLVKGIDNAIKKWDETLGFKLMSWVIHRVHSHIEDGIYNQCNTVRLPLSAAQKIRKRNKFANKIETTKGYKATEDDIKEAFLNEDNSIDKYLMMYKNDIRLLSQDNFITYDVEKCTNVTKEYQRSVEDIDNQSDYLFEKKSLLIDIRRNLDLFPEKEAVILSLFFGFPYNNDLTKKIRSSGEHISYYFDDLLEKSLYKDGLDLEDISSIIGLTRERVRQIKEKALSRFRNRPKSLINLQKYLG